MHSCVASTTLATRLRHHTRPRRVARRRCARPPLHTAPGTSHTPTRLLLAKRAFAWCAIRACGRGDAQTHMHAMVGTRLPCACAGRHALSMYGVSDERSHAKVFGAPMPKSRRAPRSRRTDIDALRARAQNSRSPSMRPPHRFASPRESPSKCGRRRARRRGRARLLNRPQGRDPRPDLLLPSRRIHVGAKADVGGRLALQRACGRATHNAQRLERRGYRNLDSRQVAGPLDRKSRDDSFGPPQEVFRGVGE